MAARAGAVVMEDPDRMAEREDFIFQDGRRYVRPYHFVFVAHVKKRWEGQHIADFFAKEFRQRSLKYYVRKYSLEETEAVQSGRIRVAGEMVSPSYVLRDSQTMTHAVHRHEPPVLAGSLQVLVETPSVITVCKPASIPVHPCGQYRKNTVLGILQAEHGFRQLFPIHRLDRLVSGLLILARNATSAESFRKDIEGGHVRKEYVAKVVGVFPEGVVVANAPIAYDTKEGRSRIEANAISTPKEVPPGPPQPLEPDFATLSHKQRRAAKARARERVAQGEPVEDSRHRSREACTRFCRRSTDGATSIVMCMPETGRTHQIRVHLQHLGHPIANDALYLSSETLRSEAGTSADAAARAALKKHRESNDSSLRQVHSRDAATLLEDASHAGQDAAAQPLVEELEECLRNASKRARTDHGSVEKNGHDIPDAGLRADVSDKHTRVGGASSDSAADHVKDRDTYRTERYAEQGTEEAVLDRDSRTDTDASRGGEDNPLTPAALAEPQAKAIFRANESGVGEACLPEVDAKGTPEGPSKDPHTVFEVDPLCPECPALGPKGYEEDDKPLWLHCTKYSGSGWIYECHLPAWAQ